MTFSLVLADDHDVVRQGLKTLFQGDSRYKVVGEAADGLEAIRLVERFKPDVLVLDLMMPNLNGLEALRIARQRAPGTRVVIFSMLPDEALVCEALRCGAQGYVLKGGNASEMLNAVQTILDGRRYLGAGLSEERITMHLSQAKPPASEVEKLTPRERQVLQLAAEGKSSAEIASVLYVSPRTVEMHRANLMHKLGLRTRTDLILFALQNGLLLHNRLDRPSDKT